MESSVLSVHVWALSVKNLLMIKNRAMFQTPNRFSNRKDFPNEDELPWGGFFNCWKYNQSIIILSKNKHSDV